MFFKCMAPIVCLVMNVSFAIASTEMQISNFQFGNYSEVMDVYLTIAVIKCDRAFDVWNLDVSKCERGHAVWKLEVLKCESGLTVWKLEV